MDAHSIGARPSATTNDYTITHLNDRPTSGPSRRALLAGLAVLPLSACPAPVPARPAGVCAKLAELIDAANDARDVHNRHDAEVVEPLGQRVREAIDKLPHVAVPIRDDVSFWTTANPEAVRTARALVRQYPAGRNEAIAPMRKLSAAAHWRDRAADRIRRDMGLRDAQDRDHDLGAAMTDAEWKVANFPAATPADFHAKVAFMVGRQMFDGIDHSELMLADAARLAGREA